MAGLWYGASLTASPELGLTAEERSAMERLALQALPSLGDAQESALGSGDGVDADIRLFRDWAQQQDSDEDLRRDSRMMVPLFYDIERDLTKVWAFLGWESRAMHLSFAKKPKVRVLNAPGVFVKAALDVRLATQHESAPFPVVAETYVATLLDRDEFRVHCDKFRTREQILANLQ